MLTHMAVLRDAVLSDAGLDEFERTGDVPMVIRMGGKKWPLGRYLREKIRNEVGVSESYRDALVQAFYIEKTEEMRELRENFTDAEGRFDAVSALNRRDGQKIRNVEAKAAIFQKRNTI